MGTITPERYLLAMRKTPVVLNALLKDVSQEQAQQLTDGPGGWNVVETMCHMRDFSDISLSRAQAILSANEPLLPNLDPEETAKRPHQTLAAEFAAYLEARKGLMAVLEGVSGDQWDRRGIHAHFGSMTLLELLVFIEWHDMNHIEQIARILKLSDALV